MLCNLLIDVIVVLSMHYVVYFVTVICKSLMGRKVSVPEKMKELTSDNSVASSKYIQKRLLRFLFDASRIPTKCHCVLSFRLITCSSELLIYVQPFHLLSYLHYSAEHGLTNTPANSYTHQHQSSLFSILKSTYTVLIFLYMISLFISSRNYIILRKSSLIKHTLTSP